jgi:6-phosphogluconolactonase
MTDGIVTLRPHGRSPGRQGLEYAWGISAQSVGALGIGAHVVTIPPGARARAHLHADHETAIYMLGPAQIEFDPSGDVLVVTEKATNAIDTYTVGRDGRASGPDVFASAGQTPFGFAFAGDDTLIVSEAFGGTASALSSYDADRDGGLATVTSSLFAGSQRASCWVVVTDDDRVAFTTNTGSGTISSYAIGHDGRLSLLDDVAVQPGGAPIDAALSRGSRFLYVLNAAQNRIGAYSVGRDGTLETLTGFGASGLPAGANGLVAL